MGGNRKIGDVADVKSVLYSLLALFVLTSCSQGEVKVYSLSEIGAMKHVYRYANRDLSPANAIIDAGYPVNNYITYFNVSTLNNGSAFVTLTITTDTGTYTANEYMLLGDIVDSAIYPDTSITAFYYKIDLTNANAPALTMQPDFDGNLSNSASKTVIALQIK